MKKMPSRTNTSTFSWIITFAVIASLLLLGYALYHRHQVESTRQSATLVTSFASCKASPGSVVLESSPEVCVTRSGARFTESPSGASQNYPLNKTKYIDGFNAAPDSLKQALLNTYFDKAQVACLKNDQTYKDAPDDMVYISVLKVAGNSAAVQFCPSKTAVVLINTSNGWQDLRVPAASPPCSTVDRYKISRHISPVCVTTGSATRLNSW